jgi:hypothetical protein
LPAGKHTSILKDFQTKDKEKIKKYSPQRSRIKLNREIKKQPRRKFGKFPLNPEAS